MLCLRHQCPTPFSSIIVYYHVVIFFFSGSLHCHTFTCINSMLLEDIYTCCHLRPSCLEHLLQARFCQDTHLQLVVQAVVSLPISDSCSIPLFHLSLFRSYCRLEFILSLVLSEHWLGFQVSHDVSWFPYSWFLPLVLLCLQADLLSHWMGSHSDMGCTSGWSDSVRVVGQCVCIIACCFHSLSCLQNWGNLSGWLLCLPL